jgi:hypothetical protein
MFKAVDGDAVRIVTAACFVLQLTDAFYNLKTDGPFPGRGTADE